MRMVSKLWTINGLATELGRDRRAIAKLLRNVPPDGRDWPMQTGSAIGRKTATPARRSVIRCIPCIRSRCAERVQRAMSTRSQGSGTRPVVRVVIGGSPLATPK
jgi:hypothetical protein